MIRAKWPLFGFTRFPSSEDSQLAEHRRSSDVPISKSPFDQPMNANGEFRVDRRPTEVEYSDLLLEIAMTTAFASLTEGTPIFEASNVVSYLSFFALVWWIWVSQVAYNVRFRRADWMHRLFVFLQFFVFCGLAAFTRDFNVTDGIVNNFQKENQIDTLEREAFQDDQVAIPLLDAQKYRDDLLPKLNSRGISIVMALSRFLLLVQYSVAYYHALQVKDPSQPTKCDAKNRWRLRYPAFIVHILSLLFSVICFFVASAIIGDNPDDSEDKANEQIAKLVLWYFPLFVEVAAHFVAISRRYKGWVSYNSELISKRSATVFVIILGGGLDNITNGFQRIVGNISFGWRSLGVIFCGVVILLLLFALHFNTPGPELGKHMRFLSAFFFQFFCLSAVIISLEAISAMLQAGNIADGLDVPLQFIRDTTSVMEIKGFGRLLNESDYRSFSDIDKKLKQQGLELGVALSWINIWIDNAINQDPPDFNLPYNSLLSYDEAIIETVLINLDSYPDKNSLLAAKMDAFYYSFPDNYTMVNNQTFKYIVNSVIIAKATPALWFYGSGGAFLVTLGLLSLISQWPRDKFEWGQILSRILFGSSIILLSILDLHSSRNSILREDFHYGGSKIWYLVTHSWVLPPYALALFVEHIIELILLKIARRYSDSANAKVSLATGADANTSNETLEKSDAII
ncbi:hypothetical protein K435DRAFT_799765 [Dendrothele bispora CBS 962.96]|uniref:Uncharacterized protein n=1 Tax=Dendrothele bispora (strain CBS 962.96) TaxID=1314807 RepID=A0A4S8LVG8_DENBC|nr:hypothetical protein K435DRAFT_799765 [Dendrothele bispora CBS 962.96]